MDVDLRKLRYFVAVAEESHFGRAAERLHITQPVLSRQIRALEHELGAQLFTRGRQSTELTAAGGQLLEDARPLLAAAEALGRRVQQAAHEAATFTVGFMPGITVTRPVREFTARHPELNVQVVRTSWDTQVQSVHEGVLDVSFVRLPVEHRGLTLRPLFHEPRVAVLPAHHRLAGKHSISIADLAAEQLLQDPDAVPEWRDLPGRTSAGRPDRGLSSTRSRRSWSTSRPRGRAGPPAVDGGLLHPYRRRPCAHRRHRPQRGLPRLERGPALSAAARVR